MTKAQKGVVYLVGSGPGDPELLTLCAASLLSSADVVLHDGLITQAVLDRVSPLARVINVEKRCGLKKITQQEIHALMVEAARAGDSVVRLKSGDPLVYGRAAEEMEALQAAEIPFHVVPGITAGFAAAAMLHASLTDRRSASKIIFVTGQQATHTRKPAQNSAPAAAESAPEKMEPVWQGSLPEDATLIVYMPGRTYRALAENLLAQGMAPEMPCVAVSRAGQPEQRTQSATLEHLAEVEAGPAPTLVMIGQPMARAAERNAALQNAVQTTPE